MTNKSNHDNPWRAAALVSAIGVDLVVLMIAGYFGGRAIAVWTDHPYWIVIGILGGLLAGIASIVLIMRKFTEDDHG